MHLQDFLKWIARKFCKSVNKSIPYTQYHFRLTCCGHYVQVIWNFCTLLIEFIEFMKVIVCEICVNKNNIWSSVKMFFMINSSGFSSLGLGQDFCRIFKSRILRIFVFFPVIFFYITFLYNLLFNLYCPSVAKIFSDLDENLPLGVLFGVDHESDIIFSILDRDQG